MTLRRVFFAVVFLALTVSAVNAYTVVMRDGRRVEIPNEFTVTNSTLTYAVSNGFQVTIQLNTVDIAATERANNQPKGSFLQKAGAPAAVPNTQQTRARRSITNQDLEVYRKARVENERAYEEKRIELGLPSAEDRRREVAEIEDRTLEQVRSMRAQEIPWSYPVGGSLPFDGFGFGVGDGRFGRFRRFQSSPFDGFLATPITPFPTFHNGRRPVFRAPGVRINPRPFHGGRGSRR